MLRLSAARRCCVVALGSLSLLLGSLVSASPAHAISVTYVSGVGDDANPCTIDAPCKTFAGAYANTDSGGTIIAMDAGGFGQLTITGPVTIDGSATEAGILAAGTSGLTINAGANDQVVLRGLDIHGLRTNGSCAGTPTTYTMSYGINIVQAGSVTIEDTRIAFARTSGVRVAQTAGSVSVSLSNMSIRNGCGAGVSVEPAAGASADVAMSNSNVTGFATGVSAGSDGRVVMTGSTIFGNEAATQISGTGVVDTSGPNNYVVANGGLTGATTGTSGPAGRTWVSGLYGDDVNPCSRTAPCRTFAGALPKTATGGEINVLDNADYGTVTITKSITLDATPVGGTMNGSSAVVTVSAPATEDVILRGLTLGSGTAGAACSSTATAGLRILSARTVRLENSTIMGVNGNGIDVVPTSSPTRVFLTNSTVSDVCGTAVNVAPVAGQEVPVLMQWSSISASSVGAAAATGASVTLVCTTVSGTGTATSTAGGTIAVLCAQQPASIPRSAFTFWLPSGEQCSEISPVFVVNGSTATLPGADAACRTPGARLLGWTIPGGSNMLAPGTAVQVVDSQKFTAVIQEPVVEVVLDANVAAMDPCLSGDMDLGLPERSLSLYLQRPDLSVPGRPDQPLTTVFPAPAQASCTPLGYRLAGWNTRGDGAGTTVASGEPFGVVIPTDVNVVTMYAVWAPASADAN